MGTDAGYRKRRPHGGKIVMGLALMAAMLGLLPSCTRYVVKDAADIEVQEKVLITFNNGDQLRGRLGLDEWVDLTIGGIVYRGRIDDLNSEEILIGDAVPVRVVGNFIYEFRRLEDARIQATEEVATHTLLRSEIQQVQMIKIDGPKLARRVSFWSFLGVGLLLLFREHS
ncbi:MAG: hypothetical protein KJ970_00525 [Candidatus Eisenbacteria bacterium]|uniref:Uncharacterized protein n=1 Tax=Eiseniibacteriota bacterium TaxID=2212470 RepID=A0A948RTD4_UNCEI|nr:hypothetical protein [Candidatus Eisenbacteria bacterium]MBU1948628.1 hypothetical protein [Candidatus Eisenbacteria bacterium]MBU2689384.1 hypothetical protein [Candidatus Eisenbacteria bacterium]